MNDMVTFNEGENEFVMNILDENGERWIPAQQVGAALGTANIRALISRLAERGELKEDIHFRNVSLQNQGGFRSLKLQNPLGGNPNITILSYRGIIRVSMKSEGSRAPLFRDWAEDILYAVMTAGQLEDATGAASPVARQIPAQLWHKIRAAGQGVRLSYRVKLLGLACQMNRLDQTRPASREGVLLDYAALCENICSAPELPADEREESVRDFIAACCLQETGVKVQAADIYSRYAAWYLENVGDETPTATWFGRELAQQFHKAKSQGCVWYYGISLTDEEEQDAR